MDTPLPPFSSENLTIWFTQMESAFALKRILEESEKYDYILINIPSESLRIVEDIILNPPTNNKYFYIKHEFIKRTVIKKMMEVEFGNETPSEYLRKLIGIAGQRVSNEDVLNLWLNNLPEKVRHLVSLGSCDNMDRICDIADRAIVLVSPTPQRTTKTTLKIKKQELLHIKSCKMMKRRMLNWSKELEIHMSKYEYDEDNEDDEQELSSQENILNAQKETLNTSNQNSIRSSSSQKICWYHTNFGDKAIACVAPCQQKCCPTMNLIRVSSS